MLAAEQAKAAGAKVVLDIDFRPNQWHDVRAFGVQVRAVLPLVDVVIGTEDEINAAMLDDPSKMSLTHSQISDTKVEGDSRSNIEKMLQNNLEAVVEKVGAEGAKIHLPDGEIIEAGGFPVDIYNILGAGDAFGAGFIYGYVNDWGWYKSARLGNACGAIVVTEHGCANFMPTMAEIEEFVKPYGGLE
jgi:5-dehydro-2-deoxygluconokinase